LQKSRAIRLGLDSEKDGFPGDADGASGGPAGAFILNARPQAP
jgi:hypothetical protein